MGSPKKAKKSAKLDKTDTLTPLQPSPDAKIDSLLRGFTQVLSLHQDIEDVLRDDDLSKSRKLKKLAKKNLKLGKLVTEILPG